MSGFSLRTYREILDDVQQARSWYRSRGIETSQTRLDMIEETVRGLTTDLDSKLSPEVIVQKWSNAATYYALSDGAAFGKITREIAKVGPNSRPVKSLRTLLGGPLSPQDETPGDGSVNARNVFAELELAAYFSEKGIPPSGFGDFKFRFQEVNCAVQCKRLLSPAKVPENIEKAYAQLKGDFRSDADRGFIALAVEKLMSLDSKCLTANGEAAVTRASYELVENFDRQFGGTWRQILDIRVLAILVIVRFLSYSRERNAFSTAYYLHVLPLASLQTLQTRDRLYLDNLISQLQSGR